MRLSKCVESFTELHVRNPVMTASGTCGSGLELAPFADLSRLGAVVGKTVTSAPRAGNDPPRTFETASGMLNSIGLQNPGVDGVLEKYSARWARWRVASWPGRPASRPRSWPPESGLRSSRDTVWRRPSRQTGPTPSRRLRRLRTLVQ